LLLLLSLLVVDFYTAERRLRLYLFCFYVFTWCRCETAGDCFSSRSCNLLRCDWCWRGLVSRVL